MSDLLRKNEARITSPNATNTYIQPEKQTRAKPETKHNLKWQSPGSYTLGTETCAKDFIHHVYILHIELGIYIYIYIYIYISIHLYVHLEATHPES